MNNTNTKLLPKFISDKPADNNFLGLIIHLMLIKKYYQI